MNLFKIGIRYVVMILLGILFISFSIVFSYANENINMVESLNEIKFSTRDSIFKPIISSPVTDINTPIIVSFDNTNVLSYAIESNGIIATETEQGSMEYEILATEEFGILDMYATYSNNVVVKSSIYTYKTVNKVYVSDISLDQAFYNFLQDVVELGEMALNVAQETYYEWCAGCVEEYLPQTSEILQTIPISGKTIVQGKLFWQEDKYLEIVPLIKVKVQLIKKVNGITHIISSQYTNPDGSFKFDIDNSNWSNNGEDIFIRWWLEAETFKVTNNWIIDHYCFQSSLQTNVVRGDVKTLYYVIPRNDTISHYKATYVHQAMVMSERFAIEMGMSVPNYANGSKTKLNVAYPALLVDQSSAYSFGNDLQSLASIGEDNWNDIDTITHEYGHYVQYLMGIYGANLLEIVCNGPQHHPLEDHMLDNLTKEYEHIIIKEYS